MKILLINKFLYPKGGAEIYTMATGNLLKRKGHEVLFWGMHHPENQEYSTRSYFVDYVDYERKENLTNQLKAAVNLLYSFKAKANMKRLIEQERPDIVHLNNIYHQISPSILDVFAREDIPTVMTLHDYKLVCPSYLLLTDGKPCERCKGGNYYHCFFNTCTKDSYAKSFLNVVEMYLHHTILHIYEKVDIFISPSKFLKKKILEMGLKGKVIYLPNFIDGLAQKPSFGWTEKSIVYFGRLSAEKGLFTLLDAVKDIEIQLKIIGDGPLAEELKLKASEDHISNVVFRGYKKGKELREEIEKSMIVIVPSECFENNPLSVIEAFALGKPVIGSRIGGIPELVRDGETGYTFSHGNAEDLREKIGFLLKDTKKIFEMGQKAREFVDGELNVEVHYTKLMDIYREAIRKRKQVRHDDLLKLVLSG